MNPFVEKFVPLVEFLSHAFGSHCEVVLHDLTDLDHSIVAISENRLTGRDLGGAVSDFVLDVLHNQKYRDSEFIANYSGYAKETNRQFRSSTMFIKNDEHQVVGMLCVNIDISPFKATRDMLDSLIPDDATIHMDNGIVEHVERFSTSSEVLAEDILLRTLTSLTVPADRLTLEEKRHFVLSLYKQGFFLIKGSVARAAQALNVSEPTIYRYLKDS